MGNSIVHIEGNTLKVDDKEYEPNAWFENVDTV